VIDKKFPARVHPILAKGSNSAIIFRRGPSKYVCTLSWDLKTDVLRIGQWLHGRIYERRSDISPDGKHIIYFAMNGKWQSDVKGSWTAISRTPWLKAINLFPKGDCWNGGGLFINNKSYWLNDSYCHENLVEMRELKRDEKYRPNENYGGECSGVYYLRLQRDGWKLKELGNGSKFDSYTIFEKELTKSWVLVKTAHEQIGAPEGKGCYWDEHACINEKAGEMLTFPNWEWAEFNNGRLLYSENGCLYSTKIQNQKALEDSKLLYDFNDMKFEEIEAPY
jgi:hypothetical protein